MMSGTDKIYLVCPGKKAITKDIVNIFDFAEIDEFPDTKQQKDYFEVWMESLRRGLKRIMTDEMWSNLIKGVVQELPFPPAYLEKYVLYPVRFYGNINEEFDTDVSYFGDWTGENFPCKEYYYKIEWIKVRPRYLKYRGRLIGPEVVDASEEFEALLKKYSIPYEEKNGTYCIYGYR